MGVAIFAEALYEGVDARGDEAEGQFYKWCVGMLQAEHLLAALAIEVNMVFGMGNIRTTMFANGKTGDTIGTYDLVYEAGFFEILECAVERDTVNLAESSFELGV